MRKNRRVAATVCALICGVAATVLAEPTPAPSPAAVQIAPPSSDAARAREFQGDDVGQVLRLLARQAKIDLVVAEAVKGNISLRLENSTALQAIEVIVHANKLSMTKDERGVYYVDPSAPPTAMDASTKGEGSPKSGTEESLTASIKQADTKLDYLARPETVVRIATYKRNLYDALCRVGFPPNDALQIIAADHSSEIAGAMGRER